jgi:hypothetical protein
VDVSGNGLGGGIGEDGRRGGVQDQGEIAGERLGVRRQSRGEGAFDDDPAGGRPLEALSGPGGPLLRGRLGGGVVVEPAAIPLFCSVVVTKSSVQQCTKLLPSRWAF